MKSLSCFLFVFALLATTSISARPPIASYGTDISPHDHLNTKGEPLATVKDILKQDRSNYYHHKGDLKDQPDTYFSNEMHRNSFENAHIRINPALAKQIKENKNKDVLITVFVVTPNEIDVEPGLPKKTAEKK